MLTLVRSWIERIDFANSAATEITETLWGSGSCTFSIVSVMKSCLIGLAGQPRGGPFREHPVRHCRVNVQRRGV